MPRAKRKTAPYGSQNKRRKGMDGSPVSILNAPVSIDAGSSIDLPEIIVRSPPSRASISTLHQSNSSPLTSHNLSPDTPIPQGQMTLYKFQIALGLNETDMKRVMEFGRLTCQSCGTFDPAHFGSNRPSIRTLERTKPEVVEHIFAELRTSKEFEFLAIVPWAAKALLQLVFWYRQKDGEQDPSRVSRPANIRAERVIHRMNGDVSLSSNGPSHTSSPPQNNTSSARLRSPDGGESSESTPRFTVGSLAVFTIYREICDAFCSLSSPQQDNAPDLVAHSRAFLDQVKARFQNQPHVFDRFLDTFVDYRKTRTNFVDLMIKLQTLLCGHDDLIRGLDLFRPHLNRIHAMSCVDRIRRDLEGDPQTLQEILNLLEVWRNQRIDLPGLVGKVSRVLHGKPDLIRLFNIALPISNWIYIHDDTSPATPTSIPLNGLQSSQPWIEAASGVAVDSKTLFTEDELAAFSIGSRNLDWPMCSREELEDLFDSFPLCTEKMMATWIKLLISVVDWKRPLRGSPIFLSSYDFDSFMKHQIVNGQDPSAAFRGTQWYYQNPDLGRAISLLRSPHADEDLLRSEPLFFESPLLFPFLTNVPHVTAPANSNVSLWICTRFAVDHRVVEIHATHRICRLFEKYLQRVADFLNQKLPHVLKFWGQGDRTVLLEDLKLVEIDTDHSDVAFSMGWLSDNARGKRQNGRHVALSMTRQDLIQSIYNTLSRLYKGGADPIVI